MFRSSDCTSPIRRRFRRSGMVGTVALSLLLAGCGGNGSTNKTEAGSVGDVITFGTSLVPPSLNPAIGDPAYGSLYQWAYDPLVVMNGDGTFSPGLAEKWGYVGEGNMNYELTLRKGVKFSDGTPLDAQAVKTFLDYQRSQKTGSVPALFVKVKSIDVTGPLTLRISMSAPEPNLTFNFAQAFGGGDIASPKAIAKPASLDTATAGAGPYMLDPEQTVANDHYVFVPNPYYWDKGRQHFKKVTVRVIPNPATMVQAMQSGQIQAALGDPTTLAAARRAGLTVIAPPQALTGLNLGDRSGAKSKPLGDVRVRQALNYAVDRAAIAKALYGDEKLALSQYALEGQPGYDAALGQKYPYDPDKAKELLAQAGYPDGFTLPVISTPLASLEKVTQAIGGQLEKVGVKLDITSKPAGDYFAAMIDGTYPAASIGYGLANMGTLYAGFVFPQGPFNFFHTEDPKLAALYNQYFAASAEESADAQQQINDYLTEQAWTVPVVGAPLSYYLVKGLSGWDATSANAGVPWLTELHQTD